MIDHILSWSSADQWTRSGASHDCNKLEFEWPFKSISNFCECHDSKFEEGKNCDNVQKIENGIFFLGGMMAHQSRLERETKRDPALSAI